MDCDAVDSASKKEYDGTRSYTTTRMGTVPFPAALDDQISSALEGIERDSYQWLLDSPAYNNWRSGENQFLNIIGEAGAGKSTLAAAIISDLKPIVPPVTPGSRIGLAFFIRSDYRLDHPEFIHLTLAAQLSRLSSEANKAVDKGYEMSWEIEESQYTDKTPIEGWVAMFTRAAQGFERMYIILDGLSENACKGSVQEEVLEVFKRVVEKANNVCVLMTSDNAVDLQQSSQTASALDLKVDNGNKWNNGCRDFVRRRVARDERLNTYPEDSTQKLVETVTDSNFLLAKLQLDIVGKRLVSGKDIQEVCDNLPGNLHGAYKCLIESYTGKEYEYLHRMLVLMAYTYEPHGFEDREPLGTQRTLNVKEITDYLLTEVEDIQHKTDVRKAGINVVELFGQFLCVKDIPVHDDEEWARSKITVRKDWVSLAHPSLKQYIQKWVPEAEGHAEITRRLMAYNCFEEFASDFSEEDSDDDESKSDSDEEGDCGDCCGKPDDGYPDYPDYPYTFRWYAALHLSKHAKDSGIEMEQRWYDEFFRPDAPKYRSVQKFCNRSFEGIAETDRIIHTTPIEYLARDGVHVWLKRIVRDGLPKYTNRGSSYCTGDSCPMPKDDSPLDQVPDEETFKVLVATPGINIKGGLSSAARINKECVDHMLLLGADINEDGGEPLAVAARNNSADMVRYLISRGANVNAGTLGKTQDASDCRSADTALTSAINFNAHEVIQVLLDAGADVNAIGGLYCSPLCCATNQGYLTIMKTLLDNGADVNLLTPRGTALHLAAKWAAECDQKAGIEMLELLLQRGADPKIVGGLNGTALIAAIRGYVFVDFGLDDDGRSQLNVLRLLLGSLAVKDAINVVAGKHYTAVAAAAGTYTKRTVQILKLLVDNGADVNLPRGVPLLNAINKGNLESVKFLLEAGANANAAVSEEMEPLPYDELDYDSIRPRWAKKDGKDQVDMLKSFGTPLHLAAAKGRKDVVELLLQHGADKDKAGGCYGSAISAARKRAHREIVELFGVDAEGIEDVDMDVTDADKKMRKKLKKWKEPKEGDFDFDEDMD